MSRNDELLIRLNGVLGDELFQSVLSEFSGERIYFPSGRVCNDGRNREICRAFYYEGKSVEQIACEHCLSYSQVRRIINAR